MIERQLQRLDELAEMGLNVARAIERQALAVLADEAQPPADGVAPGDIGLAFARVSRAVRMTIALQSRLIGELQTLDRATAFDARCARINRAALRSLLDDPSMEGIVERILKAEHPDPEQGEQPDGEAAERPEDLYGDVRSRSFDEIVALICEDLGLEPEWGSGFTSPIAAAMAGEGPPADPGVKPGEERVVEGASRRRHATASPVRDSS